jgi:transcriptional regulator with XRE-family HTH domain
MKRRYLPTQMQMDKASAFVFQIICCSDFRAMKSAEEKAAASRLSEAMRAIRRQRGLRASEVARAMGMPLRSYEHFEAGNGRISYERLVQFAKVTESDAAALLAAIPLRSERFPIRCADNKLMMILFIAVAELEEELGDDIMFLEAATLIGAFTRVKKELVQHVRNRDQYAEAWLKEKSTKVHRAAPLAIPQWRKRTT